MAGIKDEKRCLVCRPEHRVNICVVGLGIANLFPLTMSVALGVAPSLANAASARISLGGGLAILTVPLAVGWLADRVTLRSAFAVEALLLLLAMVLACLIGRLISRQAGATAGVAQSGTKR